LVFYQTAQRMTSAIFKTLVAVDEVSRRLGDPNWVIADCRYDLMDPDAGRRAYLEGHVPGARYAHLHDDLAGEPLTDRGRHPLPSAEALSKLFSRLGIDASVQVVVYDHADAGIAARLWWLLRYMGHEAVAVMDGGFRAWESAKLPLESGSSIARPKVFHGHAKREWVVTLEHVAAQPCLVDARAEARYRGDEEPLDPVAGHIPGARNHPYHENVDADGRFRSPRELEARFRQTLGEHPPESAVYYCGSGVTACQVLLAAAHAGLPAGRLYAGSWSEWCSDPERPVARGQDRGPALVP
jgi:thiosulfate/3-mercaptopyruvate sulfurtransferase